VDKKKLAGYALMGLSSALLVGCQNSGSGGKSGGNNSQAEQEAMTPQQRAFQNKLSTQGKKDFERMGSSDRDKSMKESNNCSGKNSCKGMGGCSTDNHSCKAENSCKGTGGCSKTPDEAVSVTKKAVS